MRPYLCNDSEYLLLQKKVVVYPNLIHTYVTYSILMQQTLDRLTDPLEHHFARMYSYHSSYKIYVFH